MFTTNVKRPAAALAVTAGLLRGCRTGQPRLKPARDRRAGLLVYSGASDPGTAIIEAGELANGPAKASQGFYDLLVSSYSAKAKHAKGKHGKGKHGTVTASYDIRTNRA